MGKLISKILLVILLLAAITVLSLRNGLPTQLSDINIRIASLPVKYVRIEGAFRHLGKDELKAALLPWVTTGFLEVDMLAVQQAVAALPWVKAVAVRRVWPDTIDIQVEEKVPYVRWGENSLITEQGVIFTPKDMSEFSQLMILAGPKDQQLKVLEIMKGVTTALADQSISLAEFHVSDRWSWTIKLATGLEIRLGRDEGQLKKLQRFLKTLTVLTQEQIEAMAVVDLRYPNGYAVSWKPDRAAIDWTNGVEPNHPTNADGQQR